MLKSLLIANRGEIATRVMRTAQRLGIRTIAVYSDADKAALHTAMADEAVHIGPAEARASYLNAEKIIAAAKATGAEAIHPGYGFLSENADFAQACTDAGIIFVGPPASAIRAMGLKDRAKALMQSAGVPIVPGYMGDNQSTDHLAAEAQKIGYPVLIKAVAGGGGKGMRKVESAGDFASALASAQREAKSSFNDDRVLIEKYVTRPRHIEVQIFADAHGNAVHLFERDCSLQRRHQKVIEEAPAPGMSEEMREVIGAAAVKAAKAVNYVGAGTIEFIADASDGLKPDRIWFMEMNTRLQVEHPVTEAITGLDLVEWQLQIASGRKLPKRQHELKIQGHAVEARLYAEDPYKTFLPSIGTLERLHIAEDENIRIDTGVREGDTVTPFYDPMIAKVIAWSEDRSTAITTLASALSHTQIAGVATNTGFLVRTLRNADFAAADIDTGFIDRHLTALITPPSADAAAITAANFLLAEREHPTTDPWSARDGFRLSGDAKEHIALMHADHRIDIEVLHTRSGTTIAGNAPAHPTNVMRLANGDLAVMQNGDTQIFTLHNPLDAEDATTGATDRITAPMPGKIIQLFAKAGDRVQRGTPLAVLEAMKMENTLTAKADATVAEVAVSLGDQVGEGALILRFESEPEK